MNASQRRVNRRFVARGFIQSLRGVRSTIQHDSDNPNNCSTCDYKAMNDDPDLHCYMFKHAPDSRCMQHTGNTKPMQFFSKFGSPNMCEMIMRTMFQGL